MDINLGRTCFSILIVALLAGCNTSRRTIAHDDHAVHSHYARLELNEGKKWVVDKPMMAHIRNLEKLVLEADRKPFEDHAALAAGIQENLGRLVTNCTMKGKAHDELHKWLIPFLTMAQDYTDATNPEAQGQQLQRIKQALLVFNKYFE
jgi:hypothetical protein